MDGQWARTAITRYKKETVTAINMIGKKSDLSFIATASNV